MSKDIQIRKGLDLKLVGQAEKRSLNAPLSATYALVPDNYHTFIPRLTKREGEQVVAGEALFHAKSNEDLLFVSPVSGTVTEVKRGEKRKILEVIVTPEGDQTPIQHTPPALESTTEEALKEFLLKAGFWPYIKQRPYDIIANPKDTPLAIYISGFNTAPLAAEVDFMLKGKEASVQKALDALNILCPVIHVTIAQGNANSVFSNMKGIQLHKASGPHPIGNVSTQINKIKPLNKGEKVWVIKPEDLIILGDLLLTGKYNAERTIAVNGGQVRNPQYVKALIGTKVADVLSVIEIEGDHNRIIQGNPLSGSKSSADSYLGAYTNQICVLEEGDDYDFFGWNKPQPNKFSLLRANLFSFLTPNKKYNLNTNTNGEQRAFVLTGEYEQVFPMDIYPMQLLKSCLYKDIDEMEALGIYEVAPEDFALTEFICVSKLPHQQIIRDGLDTMIREVG